MKDGFRFKDDGGQLNFAFFFQAISSTILKYNKLKLACSGEQMKYGTFPVLNNVDLSILLEAWKPISMGQKRR